LNLAKYEKNPDDDGKYQCPVCAYGSGPDGGRSRAAVSRHFNATHGDDSPPITSIFNGEEKPSEGPTVAESKTEASEGPAWLDFDLGASDEEAATVSLHTAARATIEGVMRNPESIRGEKELSEFYTQQARMLRWVFKGGVDPALEWWARAVTTDEKFTIKRSSSDWELFEDVAKAWLEYRQIALPITPDFVMVGTLGAFYVPVLAKVRAKRDPNRPTMLKRWRKRRAMRRALKAQKGEAERDA